jgi:hypothetical protein
MRLTIRVEMKLMKHVFVEQNKNPRGYVADHSRSNQNKQSENGKRQSYLSILYTVQ